MHLNEISTFDFIRFKSLGFDCVWWTFLHFITYKHYYLDIYLSLPPYCTTTDLVMCWVSKIWVFGFFEIFSMDMVHFERYSSNWFWRVSTKYPNPIAITTDSTTIWFLLHILLQSILVFAKMRLWLAPKSLSQQPTRQATHSSS